MLALVVRAISHQAAPGLGIAAADLRAALMELAALASLSVPARGVIVSDDLRNQIDRVSNRYLHRRSAEQEFLSAIAPVKSREQRDAIDAAHLHIVELGELAHYYAGLASGVTLANLSRK
jgi:hypothetical protein